MGCGSSSTGTNPAISTHSGQNIQRNRNHVPLQIVKNYKFGRSITKQELEKERSEFWSTRVEGDANMWLSLRNAAEAVLTNDLTLAMAILDASNIITPTGTLEVSYDERGFEYKIPLICLTNPMNLNMNNNTNAPKEIGSGDSSELKSNRNSEPVIQVRIRINPGDINFVVPASLGDSIADLKRAILLQSEKDTSLPHCDESRQRMIFLGKELKNSQTLRALGLVPDESRVVQVFLRNN